MERMDFCRAYPKENHGNPKKFVHPEGIYATIPSLTVVKRKNRCIPCIYWDSAIFCVVMVYSILFPSFTFFLNGFHFTFGYELIIRSKATNIMKIIRDGFPSVGWDKSLFPYLDKIHCFQSS